MMEKKIEELIGWRLIAWGVVAILVWAGSLVLLPLDKAAAALNPVTEVVYPVKDFQNGTAKFYSYPAGNGIAIKYFILKSSDGVIRAAFDACDVCFHEGKGYSQKGDFMVCNNCGRRFASVRVNEVTGGCNPSALTRVVKGDKVVVQVKDILEGKKYFTFGKNGR